MKFIHLADLHFGKTLGEFDLEDDQKNFIDSVVKLAKEREVNGILIAGDVYDRANPGNGAMNLLSSFMEKLAGAGKSLFMISGNHDSDDKLNFGRSFFERQNIHIYSVFDGKLQKVELEENGQKINIYMLPFVKASQVRFFYPDREINTYEDAVKVVIEEANIDRNQCNILISHQFVAGKGDGERPVLGGSESSSVKNVGNVECIGYDIFKDFDYVALGHIHSPQKIGREEVRYAGSPLKYSLSEVNNSKSIPLIDVNPVDCTVEIELVPIKPLRDLRHIKGKKDQLLKRENIVFPDDFMYVTLTDEEFIDDAMGIFQQFYPNTVKIDYDNSHTKELEEVDFTLIREELSFSDLISQFYEKMYNCEISDEELQLINQVAREVGVADETN